MKKKMKWTLITDGVAYFFPHIGSESQTELHIRTENQTSIQSQTKLDWVNSLVVTILSENSGYVTTESYRNTPCDWMHPREIYLKEKNFGKLEKKDEKKTKTMQLV